MSEPETLDDLLRMYETAPQIWRPTLYCFTSTGKGSKTTTSTIGPVELPRAPLTGPLPEVAIWRAIADNMGAPGHAVIRMQQVAGSNASVALEMTEAMYAARRTPPAQQQPSWAAPQGPPPWQQPPQWSQQQQPQDVQSLLLKSIDNTNNLVLKMLDKDKAEKESATTEVLKEQIKRLSDDLEKERAKERKEKDDYIELVKKSAEKSDSGLANAVSGVLSSAPMETIAKSISSLVEKRGDIERIRAETEWAKAQKDYLEVAERMHEKGIVLEEQTAPAPPATAAPTENKTTPVQ